MIRSHKSLLVSLVAFGLAAVTVYLGMQFAQLFRAAEDFVLPSTGYSWAVAGVLALLLVMEAARTRGVLLGFLIYLGSFYVITDLIGVLVLWLAGGTTVALWWKYVYAAGVLPILLAFALCVAGRINAKRHRVTSYQVKVARMSGREPLKIAMISDLHLGACVHEKDLARITRLIQAQEPDIVLLCGDIYEEQTTNEEFEASVMEFAQIKSRYGTYYLPGNHEYAAQKRGLYSVENLKDRLALAGIRSLEDETALIDGRFLLVGRADPAASSRAPLAELLKDADESYPVIMMDHRPMQYKEAEESGVDLHLSGHTHGGQLFRLRKLGEWYGHSELMYGRRDSGSHHAIVSSGIGTWRFPIRIGSPSEVMVVEVTGE